MNIKYRIVACESSDTEKITKRIVIDGDLSVLDCLPQLYRLDNIIKWLEEIIEYNLPDYSEKAELTTLNLLLGSKKSKIVYYNSEGILDKEVKFYTTDLLQLCKNWKIFLEE